MKKVLSIFMITIFALSAASLFAGGQQEAAEKQEVKTAEDVVVTWRTRPGNQEESDLYKAISDQISDELDGITLVYEPGSSSSSSYQDVLKTELASGVAPDLFWIPGTDVADFVKRELLLDMRSIADGTSHSDSDFYPGPMYHLTFDPNSMKAGGKLWGLPRDVSTMALYLNLDLIAEAGAPDPRVLAEQGQWTWDAFYEVMKAISALGDDVYGYGQSSWWGPYMTWMNSAGGGLFNEDRTGTMMHTEGSLQGLAFQQKFYKERLAVPFGEDAEPPFKAGKLGMYQNGRWVTPGMRTISDFEWDVVELPKGPAGNQGNWLFWGAYVANKDTENPEAVFKLLQALTSADVQGQVAAAGANIPSRTSKDAFDAFLKFTPPENNQAFLNGLADSPASEGPMWVGNWSEYDSALGAKVSAVLNNQMSIEEFANGIESELNKYFK